MPLTQMRYKTVTCLIFIALLFLPQYIFSFDLALDVGHTPKNFGTQSSNCGKEYDYNLILAKHILAMPKSKALNISSQDGNITFEQRYLLSQNKNLFLSLHHDSMQEQFIKRDSNGCPSSKYASGFSLFVSTKNPQYLKSLEYAKKIGSYLVSKGLKPALHHAEKINGENRNLIDQKYGIYQFDDLKVLKNAKSPAVLLEAGVIVNPSDEKIVKTKAFKNIIGNAVLHSIKE
jgi:N-acetylmuramoyl-L-alanine amidase